MNVKISSTKPKILPTGCRCLDRLLHGGIPAGQLLVFYGEAATGKTTIALQCSIVCVRQGFKVIYVDADGTFPIERLRQMTDDFEKIAQHIGIFTPKNFFEQTVLVENLDDYLKQNVGLLVFDSINNLYRLALKDPDTNFTLNKELNRQLAYLSHFAKTYYLPVLITSQVHSVLEENQKIEPVAMRTISYWSPNIVRLWLNPKPNVRMASLEKFGGRSFSKIFCYFKLSDTGVE
ncbi:hypothetical protein DRO26_01205 [Candidatus Bathyarchaeota archaeon]|nr:MAG: hypothetical protein DRO26_01205 [Candidatus Bathyarchaeota archaeon]